MWKENYGKILTSAGTAIILAVFWAFYGLIVTAIEVRAEQWIENRLEERAAEFNAEVKTQLSDTTSQLEQTQIQLKGTRSQVDILQRSLEQNTKLLELLIRQTAPINE